MWHAGAVVLLSNAVFVSHFASAQQTATPADGMLDQFDEFVERVLSEWQVPGVAIGIIREHELILAKGFGYRDLQQQLPVTSRTLFPIASISKPVTATAMAVLVDQGKVRWDDRVRQHLPELKLFDKETEQQLTIRDCLTHRIGIPNVGLRWYGIKGWPEQNVTLDWLYQGLQYLEPTVPRRQYQYSNSGYFIAAKVIEKVSGEPWDQVVSREVLRPLSMESASFSVAESKQTDDYALPYGLEDNKLVRRPFFECRVVGPAGSVQANLDEMIRFLRFYLNQGELDGKRLVSKQRMKDLLTPEVVMPEFNHYESNVGFHGIGWQVFLPKGEKWARHTGSIPGFTAVIGFAPGKKSAYIVMTNLAYRPTAEVIESNIRKRLAGKKPTDDFEMFRNIETEDQESYDQAWKQRRPKRTEGTKPTYPANHYAGVYNNPAYGDFVISARGDQLRWQHHGFVGALKHYHHDTFDIEGDRAANGVADQDIARELVTFHRGDDGVDSLSVPRPPMPKAIVFTRVAK